MFSNVRKIFSNAVKNIAAASLALAIVAAPSFAQALDVGQQADPNTIKAEFTAEGHQISSYYNQIAIFRADETHEAQLRHFANIITADNDGNWYLIFSNAPLGGENTYLKVEARGTNLTYYRPDPSAHVIPPGPTENIALIMALRERGQNVVPRSALLETALEANETAYLAFSGQITGENDTVVGYIDGIVSETERGAVGLALYHTDMQGVSRSLKAGINYVANPAMLANATDLNSLNLANAPYSSSTGDVASLTTTD